VEVAVDVDLHRRVVLSVEGEGEREVQQGVALVERVERASLRVEVGLGEEGAGAGDVDEIVDRTAGLVGVDGDVPEGVRAGDAVLRHVALCTRGSPRLYALGQLYGGLGGTQLHVHTLAHQFSDARARGEAGEGELEVGVAGVLEGKGLCGAL